MKVDLYLAHAMGLQTSALHMRYSARIHISRLRIYCENYPVIWLLGVTFILMLTLAALESADNNGRGRLS